MLKLRNKEFALVLVTAPDRKTARKLARAALESRLATCVNVIPGIESHYWWEGKRERSKELMLVFKTSKRALPRLERTVLEHHPYDTPEFVVLSTEGGNRRYLDWWAGSMEKR